MIGDIDPIKAARGGIELGDESTMRFGLLPCANRGIFAINELPDLMSKIQVGLFNVMQEGDVQIKGYPVRLPLDVLLVFSANPENYTARGKIITPLKDRIGSEIRTHYPLDLERAMEITRRCTAPPKLRYVDAQIATTRTWRRRTGRGSGGSGAASRTASAKRPWAGAQRRRRPYSSSVSAWAAASAALRSRALRNAASRIR